MSIEGRQPILFDTGYRHACAHNARVAGIRLSKIEKIVLSHGHADHTGGLQAVLESIRHENPDREYVDIICHPAAIEPQYVKDADHYFYSGCPFQIDELKRLGRGLLPLRDPPGLTKIF